MPKLLKILSKGSILKNPFKYHVHLSSPILQCYNTYNFHSTSLSLSILSHFSVFAGSRVGRLIHPLTSLHFLTLTPATYISPPSLLSSTFLPFPSNYSQSSSGSQTSVIPNYLIHLTPQPANPSPQPTNYPLDFCYLQFSLHLPFHLISHT
jgi:hypothetical protein